MLAKQKLLYEKKKKSQELKESNGENEPLLQQTSKNCMFFSKKIKLKNHPFFHFFNIFFFFSNFAFFFSIFSFFFIFFFFLAKYAPVKPMKDPREMSFEQFLENVPSPYKEIYKLKKPKMLFFGLDECY